MCLPKISNGGVNGAIADALDLAATLFEMAEQSARDARGGRHAQGSNAPRWIHSRHDAVSRSLTRAMSLGATGPAPLLAPRMCGT